MEENKPLDLARRYVELTGESVFLTGKAGTGKTTFLRDLVSECPKRHVVLAPTGVAAVNAGGVTIHSFFQLPFEPYLPDVKELVTEYQMEERRKSLGKNKINIIRTLELLIIDEVSMVRADLMDAIDMTLRRYRRNQRPFGGVQLLMIGDVHQLAPVVTERERPFMERVYPSPYFFCSKALQRMDYVTIELTHVYRQQDASFVELLNRVRDNRLDAATLAALNARVARQADGADATEADDRSMAITLTTHNRQADAINSRHMAALTGERRLFVARVTGNFPEGAAPVERNLEVRVGERVMFVKNDSTGGHRYYNGKLGRVTSFVKNDEGVELVAVEDDDGDTIMTGREVWENMKYTMDAASGKIEQAVDGTFSQYPLRAAWAVTIHKAQGLTFDRVAVDAAEAFAFGQVYVALSRCRALEGLTLSSPLSVGVAFGDSTVARFTGETAARSGAVAEGLAAKEAQYRMEKLMELFGMDDLMHDFRRLAEHFVRLKAIYPAEVEAMNSLEGSLGALQTVSEKFRAQLVQLDERRQGERARQGAAYYRERLAAAGNSVAALTGVEIDNKEVAKGVKEWGERTAERLEVKVACMEAVEKEGYSVEAVQKARAKVLAGGENHRATRAKSRSAASETPAGDVQQGLVRILTSWRKRKADEIEKPAYMVFNQKTLMGLATLMPRTEKALMEVPGIGKAKAALYGKELLDMIADYIEYNGIF